MASADEPAGAVPPALHHRDLGAGPPVVLVHGWSTSSAVFEEEAALLARSRRVVVPDLRGHGRSAPAPFSLADLARDLAALLDALALDGAVLAGWSLGGQVALAALPFVRARVAGLVLASATPRFTRGEGWPHGLPAQSVEVLAHRVRRDPARALDRFDASMFAAAELEGGGPGRARAIRAAAPPPDAAALRDGLAVLAREDLRAALFRVDAPALLLHGEADPICPAGASRAMAAAMPRARVELLPGLGHAPFLSRPGLLARAVLSFRPELA
jgi:pimeloyl-[acyl-carrier protein] methyl ester esterase